jgi:hypothetical protein
MGRSASERILEKKKKKKKEEKKESVGDGGIK